MVALTAASRLIHGAGTPEATWLQWRGLRRAPLLSLDRCLPAQRRLVVVAPHPDDEVLSCGGLLQMQAARGGAVLVVAVTDGEASHRGSGHWTASRLAPVRRLESTNGLAQLGIPFSRVTRLGLPDGAVQHLRPQLVDALTQLLRPTDLVVTTWRLDGHPDHEAVGEAAAQACANVGCRLVEAPVWMWHWCVPGDLAVPWARLRGVRLTELAQQRKARALAAHRSQLTPRDAGKEPVLGAEIQRRARRSTEYFFV